jgi:hypothetical protein
MFQEVRWQRKARARLYSSGLQWTIRSHGRVLSGEGTDLTYPLRKLIPTTWKGTHFGECYGWVVALPKDVENATLTPVNAPFLEIHSLQMIKLKMGSLRWAWLKGKLQIVSVYWLLGYFFIEGRELPSNSKKKFETCPNSNFYTDNLFEEVHKQAVLAI